MFKKKNKYLIYFNEEIETNCEYCQNYVKDKTTDNLYSCSLKKIKDSDDCNKFIYDPLKREPRPIPVYHNYDSKDIIV